MACNILACNISTRRAIRTAMLGLGVCFGGAMAVTSPALAHGSGHHGGRHHGECGEHHGRYAYACGGPRYEEQHHGGRGRHHFEGYRYRDRSELGPVEERPAADDPAAASGPPSVDQAR
jgi:hypothetical protein